MASGRPDWYSSVAMHGRYVEEGVTDKYITVNVDELGNMLALMQGKLNETYTPIAVDAQGIMRANLMLQGLDFLKVRPNYGQAEDETGTRNIGAGTEYSIPTISGRGATLGGFIAATSNDHVSDIEVKILMDTVEIIEAKPTDLYARRLFIPGSAPLTLSKYVDTVQYAFSMTIDKGLTFESTMVIKVNNVLGVALNTFWGIFYAIVP